MLEIRPTTAFLIQVLLLTILTRTKANSNCTSSESTISLSPNNLRVTLIFNCYPPSTENQEIPNIFKTQAIKYTEIDLSPNLYSVIPINDLCNFKYASSLDLSFNIIKSTENAFKNLACLTSLKTLNLANNLISSPILFTDFDDTFSSQLESLNLTNNQIPYLQSASFIKSDGSSRFSNLKYLGLAKNNLKELDLLWPLTLPSQALLVDLKINPISKLVNELKLTFNNVLYKYPMINDRRVDVTTNSLQYIDDSNLLQYGLYSENDLREFLYKLSNYDLRQSNLIPTFICYCPPYGQLTVFWYKKISFQIDSTRPIYQLYCTQQEGLVYILDFQCAFTTKYTGPVTTTYSTLSTFNVPFLSTTTQNSPIVGNQFADNQTTTTTTTTTKNINDINTNYFFLFFLFIPFFILIFLIFICCIGRCCQVRTNSMCNLLCCPCFRPHDESRFTGKYYDAAICYNRFDENWLDELFIPEIMHYENNFKLHKLNINNRNNDKLNKENERILKTSKRVILILSADFLEDDFKNRNFINLIRELKYDSNSVIVCINKDLDKASFKYCVDYLNSVYDFRNPDLRESRSCWSALKSRIKYNCGLREIETLDIKDRTFWRKFFYVMPFNNYDNTKPAIITESSKKDKLPPLITRSTTEIDKTKDKRKNQLSYGSDYKDSKKLRHVIIPIPEFMRTSLGFKNNRTEENDSYVAQQNKFNYQQQDSQKNVFSSIPYTNTTTPDPVSTRVYSSEKVNSSTELNQNLSLKSSFYDKKISTVDRGSVQVKNYLPDSKDIVDMNRSYRSETPDILSLFAPQPNTVVKMKKPRRGSKSKKGQRDDEEN